MGMDGWMDGIYGGDRAKKLVDRQMCKCKEVTLLPRGRIEVNLTAHRALRLLLP